VLSLTSLATVAWLPLLVAVPMAALAGLSLMSSSRRWQDTEARSRVIATVSSG
jgi:hypothetical protein